MIRRKSGKQGDREVSGTLVGILQHLGDLQGDLNSEEQGRAGDVTAGTQLKDPRS